MFGKYNGEAFITMPEIRAFYRGVFERSLYEITGLETLTNEASKSLVAEYIPIVYHNVMIPYDQKITTGLDRYELMNNRITGKIEIGPEFLTKELGSKQRTQFITAVTTIHNRTINRLHEYGFDRQSIEAYSFWAELFRNDIRKIFNSSARAIRNILEVINHNFYIPHINNDERWEWQRSIDPNALRNDYDGTQMGNGLFYRHTYIGDDGYPHDIHTGDISVYGTGQFYTLALPALLEGYSNIYNSVDNIYNERNAMADPIPLYHRRIPVQVWREMMTLSEPLAQMAYALCFDRAGTQADDNTEDRANEYAVGDEIFRPAIRQYPQWQKLAARGLSYLKS